MGIYAAKLNRFIFILIFGSEYTQKIQQIFEIAIVFNFSTDPWVVYEFLLIIQNRDCHKPRWRLRNGVVMRKLND